MQGHLVLKQNDGLKELSTTEVLIVLLHHVLTFPHWHNNGNCTVTY